MQNYFKLLENNRHWAEHALEDDPDYFRRRLGKQAPHFLFIGCSDSRVSADLLTGAEPGDIFVHRNIAAQVVPNDLNLLSVVQYAVDVLDVKHILVCAHYGCGGVAAAASQAEFGLVDHWLAGLRHIQRLHRDELDALADEPARLARLTELSVLYQVYNLTLTPTVRSAWARGRRPLLHGLVYSLEDGHLRELVQGVDGLDRAEGLLPKL
ncbi:MAG: carbonic anhydrase [Gemmatimonadales bacterium]|nr:carbonic anhydrase [Gemmatimonadales bacterium]